MGKAWAQLVPTEVQTTAIRVDHYAVHIIMEPLKLIWQLNLDLVILYIVCHLLSYRFRFL